MSTEFGNVPPAAPRSTKTNTLAILSLVCGILSVPMFCCWFIGIPLGIAAVVLGVIARNQISRTGEQGGGLAVAGMAIGGIMAVLTLILVAIGSTVDVQKLQQQLQQQQQGMEAPVDAPAGDLGAPAPGAPAGDAPEVGSTTGE